MDKRTNSKHSTRHLEHTFKRFYDRYQTEHSIFLSHIKGISSHTDQSTYTSLMLTRIAFLYFIQYKGLLDNDTNYLTNHLKMIQDQKNMRLNFYRDFLLKLFHEGLSNQAHLPEQNAFLGRVPVLNIGLFKEHQIERNNSSTIQVSDVAFERVFAFFNSFCWQLDDRPQGNDNEINPGILGYIFEKHINQKQLGAYFTQGDVTEYIAKITLIPYLFDTAKQKCSTAFLPSGPIWQLLRENPDRYIYPAVKKGVELSLPTEITSGLNDISMRRQWNAPAPDAFALLTETWREVVARRQHYKEIRAKLETGAIQCINELITYNLDIQQFAQDVIENCKDLSLLQALHESMMDLTVLDPTCGTGAFLLAALDILEPLYRACLERIQTMMDNPNDRFNHPNLRYSILKFIITSSLYGVDIMQEATEICKLRLFLKLLAQIEQPGEIEPLPGLDGNFRTGNALIGSVSHVDKNAACEQKLAFNKGETVERRSASVNTPGGEALESKPLQENRPFHWYVEFPRVMQKGGFAVIMGNPPYVAYAKVSRLYNLTNYTTLSTGNLYAVTMERCASLLVPGGRFGMIVPASATCTDGYLPLQGLLLEQSALHISSFSDQRGKLFDIPHPRLCIITYQKCLGHKSVFSTPYLKLGQELRNSLFQRLEFTEVTQQVQPGIIPRYGSLVEQTLHAKLHNQLHCLSDYLCKSSSHKLYYTRKLSWFVQVTPFIPQIIDEQGKLRKPSELKTLLFSSAVHADIAFVTLNSNLFYWFITTGSDCRNLNMREVRRLPLSLDKIPGSIQQDLYKLSTELAEDLQTHSEMRKMSFKDIGTLTIQCIFPGRSKPIIDKIDHTLAQYYGFTDEELDFIINYDIKYRLV